MTSPDKINGADPTEETKLELNGDRDLNETTSDISKIISEAPQFSGGLDQQATEKEKERKGILEIIGQKLKDLIPFVLISREELKALKNEKLEALNSEIEQLKTILGFITSLRNENESKLNSSEESSGRACRYIQGQERSVQEPEVTNRIDQRQLQNIDEISNKTDKLKSLEEVMNTIVTEFIEVPKKLLELMCNMENNYDRKNLNNISIMLTTIEAEIRKIIYAKKTETIQSPEVRKINDFNGKLAEIITRIELWAKEEVTCQTKENHEEAIIKPATKYIEISTIIAKLKKDFMNDIDNKSPLEVQEFSSCFKMAEEINPELDFKQTEA